MGIRELLNKNQKVTGTIAAGFVVVAVTVMVMSARSTQSPTFRKAFYTTDDGKTFFTDSISLIPPFEKDGKQAVRAIVYQCGGEQKVSYLERFSADAKAELESLRKEGGAPDSAVEQRIFEGGLQAKKPGDADWIAQSEFLRRGGMNVLCPDGSPAQLVVP